MNSFDKEKGLWLGTEFYAWNDLSDTAAFRAEVPEICRKWLRGDRFFDLKSSGSTGEAGTVHFDRDTLIYSAESSRKALQLGEEEHALCVIPPDKTGGLMLLLRCMHFNWDCTLLPPAADPFVLLPEDHSCTITSLVPYQLHNILQHPFSADKLSRFKLVLIGGASMDPTLLSKLEKLQPLFVHTYGMTETASHTALKRLNGPHPDAHFYPLPGTDIRLDERGCLDIRSIVTGLKWLHTNDQAVIHPDGGFDIRGRMDFVVNSGGVKINPEQVEAIIQNWMFEHGYTLNFYAGAEPDGVLGERLVLYCDQIPAWSLDDIPDSLFPPYHKPKAIRVKENLSRTDTGKILRK